MTEQEAREQAIIDVENAKPMNKVVGGVVTEYSDSDYEQAIVDRTNIILDEYNNGYKVARQIAYLPIAEQLDMQYWDSVNGTTTWAEHIAQVKADNPKPE